MPETRDAVFDRVTVDHMMRGVTRVSWSLAADFLDPGPFTFTLQVGATGDPAADDWAQVGTPVVGGCHAVDDAVRDRGVTLTTHYRVLLATPAGAYASRPASCYGLLGVKDWLTAREIVRKERLRAGLVAVPGWLFKRRRAGPVPPPPADPKAVAAALERDPLTGDLIRRDGPAAAPDYGTGYVGGYFAPVATAFDVAPPTLGDPIDPEMRGNFSPGVLANGARCVLFPSIESRDVLVARGSDLRYSAGRVKVVAAWRGVPLIGEVELQLLPFSDVLYTLPVPESCA